MENSGLVLDNNEHSGRTFLGKSEWTPSSPRKYSTSAIVNSLCRDCKNDLRLLISSRNPCQDPVSRVSKISADHDVADSVI